MKLSYRADILPGYSPHVQLFLDGEQAPDLVTKWKKGEEVWGGKIPLWWRIYKDRWDISDWLLLSRESSNGYVIRMKYAKRTTSFITKPQGSLLYRITLCPFSLWILRPLLTSHTLRKSKTKLKFCQTENDSWRKRMVESRCIYLRKKLIQKVIVLFRLIITKSYKWDTVERKVTLRGSTATLTMIWQNSGSIIGQTHEKLMSIC